MTACVVGGLFALLATLVVLGWKPLQSVDESVVAALNPTVSSTPWLAHALGLFTDLGGSLVTWALLLLALGWLLIRREPALAAYVGVAGLGALSLTTGVKAWVERGRPVVDTTVAAAPGLSFPSGHALSSTVTYGVLLLVFLPAVAARLRKPAIFAVAALVIAIGLTRIALGVHYPSDVLGGWLLGVLWLLVSAMAFRRWHEKAGLGRPPLTEGLEPEEHDRLVPAPAHDAPLPAGWHSVSRLMVAAVLIWGALAGAGLLITEQIATVRQWDTAVAKWFASIRSESITPVMLNASRFGDTITIVAVVAIAVVAALALTRRWRPALFLVVAVVGESLLFLASSSVVGRSRPSVEHLTPGLPPTSSFPSGHVAATTAAYGAIALLIVFLLHRWWRFLAVAVAALIVLSVVVSRLYIGVHYLTDTLASVIYACTWLAVCWWIFLPAAGTNDDQSGHISSRAEPGSRSVMAR
ncbi:phosphatase PAP2 family protein [Lolliginicoccus levis]|uniref:phosphatase PAP2 family protein n=1 Tax=Lolliginicoccus levis TaxID=2919542 RepID=UPI00241C607B|nr:phosphatase PAP2 family protein [Lolliginicoccus levis]